MNLSNSRNQWIFILTTLALTFVLRLYTFYTPILDVDESFYSLIGSAMSKGGIPYVDVLDNKPPAIYAIYYLIGLIFGHGNMMATHIFTAAWVFLTALVIRGIGNKLAGDKVGNVAMLLYAISTTLGAPKYLASSVNIFMMLPISLAFYYFASASLKDRWWKLLLAGIFAFIATQLRYHGGGIIYIVIAGCIGIQSISFGRKIKQIVILCLGGIIIALPFVLILLKTGAFEDYIYWTWLRGFEHASHANVFAFWPRFLFKSSLFLLATFPLFALFIYWIYRVTKEKRYVPSFFYLIIWFALSWIPVCIGGKFYGHYYIQLLPPLSLAAAWGFVALKKQFSKGIYIIAITLWTSIFFLSHFESTGLRHVFKMHGSDWIEVSELQCPVGTYIKESTTVNDSIFVWGYAVPIYFCADRKPASRFLETDTLSNRIGGGNRFRVNDTHEKMPLNQKRWDMLFSDLEKNKPVYIVDISKSEFGSYKDYPIEDFPIYEWMMKKGYKLEKEINKARLYKLK